MAKIADFFVELGLKKDKFDAGLDDAKKGASKFGINFAAVGAAVAASFVAMSAAAVAFAIKSMGAWDAQMKAEAGLLKALNGRKDVQQALIVQAGELQRKTLFGDEATIEAQKMLAIMGLSATQIKDLIPLVQDFSTATGMDLSSAANLVGKSVGTGTNALARYGIEIDSTMSKSEKATAVMAKFTEMYGGQAAAAAKVGISGLEQLKGAWGDITELIGAKIGPFLSAIAKLTSGKLLDAASGASATGLQKTVNEYLNADKAGREGIVSGLKSTLDEYNRLWKKAVDENDKTNRQHYSLQADYVREALDAISKLEKEGTAVTEITEEQKRAAWDKTQAKIRETAEISEEVAKTMRDSLLSAMNQTPSKPVSYKLKAIDLPELEPEVSDEDPAWLTKFGENLIRAKEAWTNFTTSLGSSINDFLAGTVSELFTGIGEALTGGQNLDSVFLNILGGFGKFLSQMGAMMISYGIAEMAFFTSFAEGPFGAAKLIAAGAALALIGGAISGLASQASKGINSSGTSGVGGGAQSSLDYIMNGANQQTLSASIKGSDLVFVLEREQRNKRGV